ncbi:MAG: YbhB/YbcL family Raf kinase inhibitor-like protein [Alphaproteobacteria bacterium]|nr:YbhB/YbcL family Raf kinase inhibitor-like protein [Alphaproteobacteria bacterium]
MRFIAFMLVAMFASAAHAWDVKSNVIHEGEAFIKDQASIACDGANISPDLYWGDAPEGTKSLAMIMHDPTAPKENGYYHWMVTDIPPTVKGFSQGEKLAPPIREIAGDAGYPGYVGPCPPKDSGKHFYTFTVYALDVKKIGLPPQLSPYQMHMIIQKHSIQATRVTATYQR